MYDIIKPMCIKDLPIIRVPDALNLLTKNTYYPDYNCVHIGDLKVNTFVYNEKFSDLNYQIAYIRLICSLTKIFKDIYQKQIYPFILNSNNPFYTIYNINFHEVFDEVNNKFNNCIDDIYLMNEFLIHQSQISFETFFSMYNTFIDIILMKFKEITPSMIPSQVKLYLYKNSYNIIDLYEDMYENMDFDYPYLLFY